MAGWKRAGQKPKAGGKPKGTSGHEQQDEPPLGQAALPVHGTNRRGSRAR